MSELQQNRYDRLLRRVGDLKGPGSKVNDALTELFPVMDVERVPAELRALMGSNLCVGSTIEAGIAANVQQAMLRNTAGTGVVMTILEVRVFSATAQTIVFGPTLNTFANSGVRAFTDLRLFPSAPVGLILDGIALTAAPIFGRIRVNGDDEAIYHPPIGVGVVTPGTAFAFSGSIVNTDLITSWTWIERVAQPSELNL
jgi:hypothetical protein